jgi:signal transduction histidine kinase
LAQWTKNLLLVKYGFADGQQISSASFKRHNGYVLGRIAGMAAISLVLMLLTAGAFFYLLYIIRRQKQLADLKRDFINAITHELQTPIATAAAAVEALQHFNALEDPERTRAYLDITQEQLKQLSGMVDQTLQIATEERDHFPLQLQSVDVKTLVESLVQQARLAAGRPVSVSVEHHLEHPVQVDPVQLSRAIRNLLDNAIKYVLPSKTPVVCVATHPAGAGGWQISVKDNGPGIPEMYRARLFERFFRIPSEHNVKGFGLGLYVAQRIAREHGGQLLLQHSDPEGSTFVMRFR